MKSVMPMLALTLVTSFIGSASLSQTPAEADDGTIGMWVSEQIFGPAPG